MALHKPALIGSEKPWHQDNAYFKYAPLEKVVGFWMALDDADRTNGCMHVLPGWHRRGGLRHVHEEDCKILPERVKAEEAVPVELNAGGAMFFPRNVFWASIALLIMVGAVARFGRR